MAGTRQFIEVRFDAAGSVAARLTRQQPGSSVDTLLESSVGPDGRATYRGVAVARNLSEGQADEVLAGFEAKYGAPPQVLVRGPARCVFRYQFASAALADPALGVLLAFHAELGDPWVHVAGGEVRLRAEPGVDPDAAVRGVRRGLELAGVDAAVRLVALPSAEVAHWLEACGVLEALKEQGAMDGNRLPTTITPGTP